MAQRRHDPEQRVPPPGFGRVGTRVLEVAENVVYAGIAVFLVLAALALLVATVSTRYRIDARGRTTSDRRQSTAVRAETTRV